MLVAAGDVRYGSANISSLLFFERRFWAHVFTQHGLRFDTAVLPPSDASGIHTIIYFVLEGGFEVVEPRPNVFRAPAVLALRVDDFEGANGSRHARLRTLGSPYSAIELRFASR